MTRWEVRLYEDGGLVQTALYGTLELAYGVAQQWTFDAPKARYAEVLLVVSSHHAEGSQRRRIAASGFGPHPLRKEKR